jgi:hypothetical protein
VGLFSRIEGGLDSAFDRAAGTVFRGPIEPAQIAKRAEKHMNREKLVGAGKQYAPTLYTVLVNENDNRKLFGFYPTMAAEIETYLVGKGTQAGLKFDGRPLVRFIVDSKLKSGKFDVIAENVAAPIIAQLREEEMEFYGISNKASAAKGALAIDEAESGIAGASAVLPPVIRVPEVKGNPSTPLAAGGAQVGGALVGGALADLQADSPVNDRPQNALDSLPGFSPTTPPPPTPAQAASSHPSIPSPATARQARLTNINAGKSYALTKTVMVLGRDSSCDIALDDANISRQHAQLTQDVVGTWKLTDLGSTNGTQLNGDTITTALLRTGDQITVGITTLAFRED